MVFLPSLVAAGLMASAAVAGPVGSEVVPYSTCANENPTAEEQSLYARDEKQRRAQNDNGDRTPIELPVSFTYCCPNESDCQFEANDMGNKELKIMNDYYKDVGVTWVLKNSTKIQDDAHCEQVSLDENKETLEQLKEENRVGGSEELNILYLPTNQGAGKKGECIVPPADGPPPPTRAGNLVDSCVAAMDTLPGQKGQGGSERGIPNGRGGFGRLFRRQEREGDDITSVHEAGHWLSLPHVGQGGGVSGGGGLPGGGAAPDGVFSLFSIWRRAGGGDCNIMEPALRPDCSYSFNEDQAAAIRQMAQKRLQKGNSTDGGSGIGGPGAGAGGGGGKKPQSGAPKGSPQAGPKGSPQSGPKAPQSGPKAPQSGPKAPQASPKAPQSGPKAPQSAPTSPNFSPQDGPQTRPNGGPQGGSDTGSPDDSGPDPEGDSRIRPQGNPPFNPDNSLDDSGRTIETPTVGGPVLDGSGRTSGPSTDGDFAPDGSGGTIVPSAEGDIGADSLIKSIVNDLN